MDSSRSFKVMMGRGREMITDMFRWLGRAVGVSTVAFLVAFAEVNGLNAYMSEHGTDEKDSLMAGIQNLFLEHAHLFINKNYTEYVRLVNDGILRLTADPENGQPRRFWMTVKLKVNEDGDFERMPVLIPQGQDPDANTGVRYARSESGQYYVQRERAEKWELITQDAMPAVVPARRVLSVGLVFHRAPVMGKKLFYRMFHFLNDINALQKLTPQYDGAIASNSESLERVGKIMAEQEREEKQRRKSSSFPPLGSSATNPKIPRDPPAMSLALGLWERLTAAIYRARGLPAEEGAAVARSQNFVTFIVPWLELFLIPGAALLAAWAWPSAPLSLLSALASLAVSAAHGIPGLGQTWRSFSIRAGASFAITLLALSMAHFTPGMMRAPGGEAWLHTILRAGINAASWHTLWNGVATTFTSLRLPALSLNGNDKDKEEKIIAEALAVIGSAAEERALKIYNGAKVPGSDVAYADFVRSVAASIRGWDAAPETMAAAYFSQIANAKERAKGMQSFSRGVRPKIDAIVEDLHRLLALRMDAPEDAAKAVEYHWGMIAQLLADSEKPEEVLKLFVATKLYQLKTAKGERHEALAFEVDSVLAPLLEHRGKSDWAMDLRDAAFQITDPAKFTSEKERFTAEYNITPEAADEAMRVFHKRAEEELRAQGIPARVYSRRKGVKSWSDKTRGITDLYGMFVVVEPGHRVDQAKIMEIFTNWGVVDADKTIQYHRGHGADDFYSARVVLSRLFSLPETTALLADRKKRGATTWPMELRIYDDENFNQFKRGIAGHSLFSVNKSAKALAARGLPEQQFDESIEPITGDFAADVRAWIASKSHRVYGQYVVPDMHGSYKKAKLFPMRLPLGAFPDDVAAQRSVDKLNEAYGGMDLLEPLPPADLFGVPQGRQESVSVPGFRVVESRSRKKLRPGYVVRLAEKPAGRDAPLVVTTPRGRLKEAVRGVHNGALGQLKQRAAEMPAYFVNGGGKASSTADGARLFRLAVRDRGFWNNEEFYLWLATLGAGERASVVAQVKARLASALTVHRNRLSSTHSQAESDESIDVTTGPGHPDRPGLEDDVRQILSRFGVEVKKESVIVREDGSIRLSFALASIGRVFGVAKGGKAENWQKRVEHAVAAIERLTPALPGQTQKYATMSVLMDFKGSLLPLDRVGPIFEAMGLRRPRVVKFFSPESVDTEQLGRLEGDAHEAYSWILRRAGVNPYTDDAHQIAAAFNSALGSTRLARQFAKMAAHSVPQDILGIWNEVSAGKPVSDTHLFQLNMALLLRVFGDNGLIPSERKQGYLLDAPLSYATEAGFHWMSQRLELRLAKNSTPGVKVLVSSFRKLAPAPRPGTLFTFHPLVVVLLMVLLGPPAPVMYVGVLVALAMMAVPRRALEAVSAWMTSPIPSEAEKEEALARREALRMLRGLSAPGLQVERRLDPVVKAFKGHGDFIAASDLAFDPALVNREIYHSIEADAGTDVDAAVNRVQALPEGALRAVVLMAADRDAADQIRERLQGLNVPVVTVERPGKRAARPGEVALADEKAYYFGDDILAQVRRFQPGLARAMEEGLSSRRAAMTLDVLAAEQWKFSDRFRAAVLILQAVGDKLLRIGMEAMDELRKEMFALIQA